MNEQRPMIGVVPDTDLHRNRGVDFVRYQLYAEIADRLYEAGALPALLPFTKDDEAARLWLDSLDGLLLAGGDFDIDPRLYKQRPHPALGTLKPARTEFELKLCRGAYASGLPVLGICGGLQLMNVARGGTLFQDLPSQRPGEVEHVQRHNRKIPAHAVAIAPDTLLAKACGAGQLEVNTTHHQAVDALGADLVVAATAPDGLVEAAACRRHPFFVGVQWHPETLEQVDDAPRHRALFAALTEAARQHRQR